MATAKTRILQARLYKLLQPLPRKTKRQILFAMNHRYLLPGTPRTFSEKMQWRILYDRRDIIAVGGDKLRMKAYAQSKTSLTEIPKTLWFGEDLRQVFQKDWDTDWILKPISGSGAHAFGSGSLETSGLSLADVDRWIHTIAKHTGEWAYETAQSGYLIEERIPTSDGSPPDDIKVWTFGGVPSFFYWASPRDNGTTHRFYSLDWDPLDMERVGSPVADIVPPPAHLDQIIDAASEIGAEFDFVRIDFFSTPQALYFGEISPYPGGGLPLFSPAGVDRKLGDMWTLPDLSRTSKSGRL